MPIIARHHEDMELNRVDYAGSVTLAELAALAEFNTTAPTWVTYDCLSVVQPGADFLSIDFAELDALFTRYSQIYAPMNFLILRRSAWLCLSPAALRHVRYWLGDRDTKQAMSSDVRLFNTYEEAGEWLLLRPEEIAQARTDDGFVEIFRTETPLRAR